jgi:HSP20 family molecular chaperone IbpA
MAMLMTRRDPFAEFDAMIRRAFPTSSEGKQTVAFRPTAEVVRDGDDAVVRLELPGVDFANDISVELDGTTLVVAGERRDGRTAKSADSIFSEVRYGSFRRSFTLPEHVTADALSATYDAGVLAVRVAGAYAGTTPKKIAVTAGIPAATVDGDVEA